MGQQLPEDNRQQPTSAPQEPDFWNHLLDESGPIQWPENRYEKDQLASGEWAAEEQCGTHDDFDWSLWTQANDDELGNMLSSASGSASGSNIGVMASASTAAAKSQPQRCAGSRYTSLHNVNEPWQLVSSNLLGGLNVARAGAQQQTPLPDSHHSLAPFADVSWPWPISEPSLPKPSPFSPAETPSNLTALNRHPGPTQNEQAPPRYPTPTAPELEALKQQSSLQLRGLIERTAQNLIAHASRNGNSNCWRPQSAPSTPRGHQPEGSVCETGRRRPKPPLPLVPLDIPHPGGFGFGGWNLNSASTSSPSTSDGWSLGSCLASPLLSSGACGPTTASNVDVPTQRLRALGLDGDELSRLLASVQDANSNTLRASPAASPGWRSQQRPYGAVDTAQLGDLNSLARKARRTDELSSPSGTSPENSCHGGSPDGRSREGSPQGGEGVDTGPCVAVSPPMGLLSVKEEDWDMDGWEPGAERPGRKRGDGASDVPWEGSSRASTTGKRQGAQVVRQARSEVFDVVQDGHRWRKYGQKEVKGQQFPRSYYKCSIKKCDARKQVQMDPLDETLVMTTYEGEHCHAMLPPLIPSYLIPALKGLLCGQQPECPVQEEDWFRDVYSKLEHELRDVLEERGNKEAGRQKQEAAATNDRGRGGAQVRRGSR